HVCRARSHVTEKSFKAILPFRVHRNTATAIIRPGFDVRIKAAFFDFPSCCVSVKNPHYFLCLSSHNFGYCHYEAWRLLPSLCCRNHIGKAKHVELLDDGKIEEQQVCQIVAQ